MDTLVSVIIPVYNVAPYLTESIESVLHQSYTNLEIILIDDGSTDGSGEICDRYAKADRRIRVMHQENQGLSAARNAGLDTMTGDLVAFLDSDDAYHPDFDAYHPDFVVKTVKAMVRKNADLVVAKYSFHDTVGRMTQQNCIKEGPYIRQGMYDRVAALRALADGIINHGAWNKLYRKELWEDLRFPAGHVYEDIDTMYRVMNRCDRIYAIVETLYRYRKRSGSISKTYTPDNMQDWTFAQSHFFAFIEENIPDVFAAEQLKKLRQLRVLRMCIYYVHLSRDEDQAFLEDLRGEIIKLGREVGVGSCSLHMKACYRMICDCPWMVKILYPVYSSRKRDGRI